MVADIIITHYFGSLLSPNKNQKPTGKLLEAIITKFGSYEKFKEDFVMAGTKAFWKWLGLAC